MTTSLPEQLCQSKEAGTWFSATHWSVVLAAGHGDAACRQQALETLCRTYWQPIYTWLRCSGHDVPDAQDLTQGFFAHLLAAGAFSGLGAEKGKFRSFLLKSLQHFLADERDRCGAAKRGSGSACLPLDEQAAEAHYLEEANSGRTPEASFDRRWALLLLDRAFLALQQEFLASGRTEQFTELAVFLAAEGGAQEYADAANRLRMTPGAVAVAVHRLRARYRDCIRGEIAQTVNSAAEAREEMRYLLEVLCRDPI
ncbi:MAG TPA: sigma-70 family RNA polymerase sigma factor [Verrucomicrobiae bacterium]